MPQRPRARVREPDAASAGLTDTSATVVGFAVVFYSEGQELNSDSHTFDTPTYITPGQSRGRGGRAGEITP
ncbi:MAG TPA: hypothetical protein VEH05_11470 [Streptosporangiaceae bacterium]|nr:hypothetical protein [Streptosporangiaceae bacterium]